MKDEICELDIQRSLMKQFIDEGSLTNKKKRKKNKDNNQHAVKSKKQKTEEHSLCMRTDEDDYPQNYDTKTAPRPPPKVVVFDEPGKPKQKNQNSKKDSTEEDESNNFDDFMEMARDVREFGMTGFSKKDRRKYEQQKAQSLGGKAAKGQKMPYNIYMAHLKKQKQKENKRLKLEKAMGMSTKKKKNNSKDKNASFSSPSSGWWSDKSSKGLDVSIGKYKKGVQTLSKDDIKRINSKKRK